MKPIVPLAKLAIGWLTMFVVGIDLFVISPLLPPIAASYQLPPERIGLCVTAFAAAYVLSAPLLGLLSDRSGRRSVLGCCLVAFAAANLVTALADDLPRLIAARLFAGAAAAGVSPSVYALVGSAASPERRATWLAVVVSGLLLSLVLGAPLGAIAGAAIGWRFVFLVLTAFTLGLVWPNLRVWPRGHRAVATTPGPAVKAWILSARMLPMVVWSTGLYGVYSYLGVGLTQIGFSAGQIVRAILFYGCGAIAGVLIGGRAADRFGPKFMAGTSLIGLSGCFLLLRFALDAGILFAPMLSLTSAVAQLFFPAQQAGLVNDFAARRATALAWNNSALFLGISLGSLSGAQAIGIGGIDANLLVSAGIVLIGCVLNSLVVPGPSRTPRRADRAG
jgi:predicted MFS family arabinose efflux permease